MKRIAPGMYEEKARRAADRTFVTVQVVRREDRMWYFTIDGGRAVDLHTDKRRACQAAAEFLALCYWNETYGWVMGPKPLEEANAIQ